MLERSVILATHRCSNFCNIVASRKRALGREKKISFFFFFFFFFRLLLYTFFLRCRLQLTETHHPHELVQTTSYRLGVAVIWHVHQWLPYVPFNLKTRNCMKLHYTPCEILDMSGCMMLYNLGGLRNLRLVLSWEYYKALGHPKTPHFYSCSLQNWLWAKTIQCLGATTTVLK